MPLDPRVLLLGLQPQARTPYDAPDVVAERQARVQQLREAAKAKQDAEYENQLYDWAVKSNLGPDGQPDLDGAQKALWGVSPQAARKFATAVQTGKKQQAETYKLEDDHRLHEAGFVAQTLGDATAENWPDRYDFLNRTMPGVTSRYGLTREFNPTRNESVIKAATLIPEQNKVKEDARNHQLKGEWDTSIAKEMDALSAAGQLTDDTVADVLKRNQGMGAPVSTTHKWNIPLDQIPPLARTTLVGPHDRALEQQAKDTLDETKREHDLLADARVQAEVDRREAAARADKAQQALADWRDKQYGLQQRTAGRADAQLAMKQRSAAAGLDPDAVAGWVQHVMDNGTFVGVPANVKNQVMGELKRLNVNVQDLTNADLTRRNVARTIEPKIEAVKEMAKQIDQMGLTGTLGGRWRKIVSGETAASDLTDLTPAQKQLVGKFATEASGLLLSGIAMAHGGARGGGSPQLLEQIKQYLDPGNKDLNVYLGNLDGAKDFIHGYATMGQTTKPAAGGGTVQPEAAPDVPPQVLAAGPGLHTFANGQQWDVAPDGKSAKRIK